jgi:hypothetical protein
MRDNMGVYDALAMDLRGFKGAGATVKDGLVVLGEVTLELFNDWGDLKTSRKVHNLITTSGDVYYANRCLPTPGATTAAGGMKLGTGNNAVAKSGTGSAIVTYISGSNNAFDSSTLQGSGDTGRQVRYITTWAAGDATNAAIVEVAIVNDISNNSDGSTAANTYSRAVFSAINKTASDTLVATWNHTFLGAA